MEELLKQIDIRILIDGILGSLFIIATYFGGKILRKIARRLPSGRDEYQIEEAVKRDMAIFDIVSEIRFVLGGCRSQLLVFHNGSYFSTSHPIWCVDCVVESAQLGTSYNMQLLQNLPSGVLLDLLAPFWGDEIDGVLRVDRDKIYTPPDKGIFWYNTSKMPEGNTKEMLKSHDVDNMLISPVVDPVDNRVIGMLCVDFCEPTNLPDRYNEIKNRATTISYKLSTLERNEENK